MRLTISHIMRESGFCRDTVKKLANSGVLPHQRDVNNWRVFAPEAIEIAKELAGITSDKELRNHEASR